VTNQVSISGVLVDKQPLRYTPAGIPLLSFVIRHQSEQIEAGMRRQVVCEIVVMALADLALQAEKIAEGSQVSASGFIAKRSMKSTQLVLHVNRIEH
jgi:primosomal replication protein N